MSLPDVCLILALVVVWYRVINSAPVARLDEKARRAIVRAIIKRPAKVKKVELIPVIFGDGETDDLPGMEALWHNKTVVIGERVYLPGDPVEITFPKLCFSVSGLEFLNYAGQTIMASKAKPHYVIKAVPNTRKINISFSEIHFNHSNKVYPKWTKI